MNALNFFLLSFSVAGNAPTPNELIRQEDLRAHIYFLSGDELEGRAAGTEQETVAARYLAQTLASYGVRPAGPDGSYDQVFERGDRRMRNVAGWIEGSDATLKEEWLIIGAHYDHVGWGGRESLSGTRAIHNGADDNASGTASVLEMAQVFSRFPPKRSVLFLHFSGEEKGLWGSEHYCESPLRPLEKTVAMINMDMLGRSDEGYLFVGGVGTGEGLAELIEEKSKNTPLRLETKPGGLAPSDNTPFFKSGVPALFFFTNLHDDYHAPGDDWWKINYGGQETITEFIFDVAQVLANEPKRREYHMEASTALPSDFMMRMSKQMQKLPRRKKTPKPEEK